MTVIVRVPRPKPRLELGMTQLPLRQVACVIGGFSAPAGPGGMRVLLASALNGLVEAAGDGCRHVSRAGGQFPDRQRDRQGGDHDIASSADPLIHAPDARTGTVELANGGVQDT